MLHGKRCLVTGSSQGIGFGVAKAMLEAGASVLLSAEHAISELSNVRALLDTFPQTSGYAQVNLLDDHAASMLLDTVWSCFGGLDVLVNNAGTFREPAFLQLDKMSFDFIFQLNVWSTLALSQQFVLRNQQLQRGGRILFSTSLNAVRSEPSHTLYDASKSAVNGMIRQLAVELAPLGFTTIGIAPGLVETPLTDFGLKSNPKERQQILQQIPLRRMATVDDLAAWYVFLSSDAASYATGTIITVDGGLDAQQMPTRPITSAERHLAP